MSDHQEALRTIRGMALAAAAAYQGTEGVRTQVGLNDDFDPPEKPVELETDRNIVRRRR